MTDKVQPKVESTNFQQQIWWVGKVRTIVNNEPHN